MIDPKFNPPKADHFITREMSIGLKTDSTESFVELWTRETITKAIEGAYWAGHSDGFGADL